MEHTKSTAAFEEARQYIPGGKQPCTLFPQCWWRTAVYCKW